MEGSGKGVGRRVCRGRGIKSTLWEGGEERRERSNQ